MIITPNRRCFVAGLVSACAAPAIVTGAGFRSGLWLPPVNERWLAYYHMGHDTWIARVEFLTKDFPMMMPVEPGPVVSLPEQERHQFQRLFGERIAQARRLTALAGKYSMHGVDMNLTDFRPSPFSA
jgi:hypothetical protein